MPNISIWFSGGYVPSAIVCLTVIEFGGLIVLRRRLGAAAVAARFLPTILAGDFLLLAWLGTAWHWGWQVSAVWLLAALAAHVVDIARRW